MSDVVAKEGLTAYQRWELPSFNHEREAVDPSTLPTAAEIEQIRQQAQEEGFQAGYAEGAQKVREEIQQLAAMISGLESALQQVDEQVAQSLLDLSLELAQQMVQQALKVKPELVLGIVSEAVNELPHFNQHAHLILHPADAELVRSHMGEQLEHTGWKIFEDAQAERGGCRVETAHSRIDASLASRWKRVVAAIGQDSKWLEP